MFLKMEVVRNYSILATFQKEDFDLFKVGSHRRRIQTEEKAKVVA